MVTGNWLWIGNSSTQLNSNDATPPTLEEVTQFAIGYHAAGPDELKIVEVTGNNDGLLYGGEPANEPTKFFPTFQKHFGIDAGNTGTLISYHVAGQDPVVDTVMTGGAFMHVRIVGTFTDGTTENVIYGQFMQMANGDLFVTPDNRWPDQVNSILSISSITILADEDAEGETAEYPNAPYGDDEYVDSADSFNLDIQITCVARGTMIRTVHGDVPVERLGVGDMVETIDNGPQKILWIGSRRISLAHVKNAEKLRPIRIRAGALGDGQPEADLLVSPQHRILIRSKILQEMIGVTEALVAAKHLVGIDGIDPADDLDNVEYFHLLFTRHEVIYTNGAATESLYSGPEAIKSLPKDAVEEIFNIFPELHDGNYTVEPARTFVQGKIGRELAKNHVASFKPLCTSAVHVSETAAHL